MLMANGNLKQVRDELSVGEVVDYAGASELNAEIVPKSDGTIEGGWYAVEVLPNHERSAAGYFVGRRFGVFVPEKEVTIVRRGRKVDTTRLLFTGYVFVFVWDIAAHFRRIMSVPGVHRVISSHTTGMPLKIPDKMIDEIRAVENSLRPLPATMLYDDGVTMPKKKKKRWRRKAKTAQELAQDGANDIVAVRCWSPFQDALISLDDEGRNQTLRTALSLPS